MKTIKLVFSLFLLVSVLLIACKKEEVKDSASCSDGIQNGTETNIDCGGDCSPCIAAATCSDGVQNGTETGVDCGGSCSPCTVNPTCSDGVQNGNETGVDCGGSCSPCTATPTCSDGVQNGTETGVDCGGSCSPCTATPTCSDGVQNGNEQGIDCGGPDCPACFSCGDNILDFENNSYRTVQIGNQCWMAENLKSSKYNDGSDINGWANYLNNSANDGIYGKLYSYAMATNSNICPVGWHVPTDAEWAEITNYLGGSNVAGGKMKSTGTSLWDSPNVGATNSSGFTGLPGGNYVGGAVQWYDESFFGRFWSTTQESSTKAWGHGLYSGDTEVERWSWPKSYKLSCRCVKD